MVPTSPQSRRFTASDDPDLEEQRRRFREAEAEKYRIIEEMGSGEAALALAEARLRAAEAARLRDQAAIAHEIASLRYQLELTHRAMLEDPVPPLPELEKIHRTAMLSAGVAAMLAILGTLLITWLVLAASDALWGYVLGAGLQLTVVFLGYALIPNGPDAFDGRSRLPRYIAMAAGCFSILGLLGFALVRAATLESIVGVPLDTLFVIAMTLLIVGLELSLALAAGVAWRGFNRTFFGIRLFRTASRLQGALQQATREAAIIEAGRSKDAHTG